MFVVELSVLRWFFCELPLGNSEGPNYSYEHQLAAPFAIPLLPFQVMQAFKCPFGANLNSLNK